MSLNTRVFLRLLVKLLVLTVFAGGLSRLATAQDESDPMGLPPRTSQPPASAQAPEQPQQGQPGDQSITPIQSTEDQGRFVFKKQVQEVVLHATVVDESGRLVTGLDRSDFSVFQNGQRETVTSFRREDIPVALGIVVDNSGSMRDKRAKVNQAVLNLIRASNPQDQVFVVNFSQTPYLDQDFTSDENLLQAALHQVSSRGSTALYDAVVASNVHLRNNPVLDKKVLLVITDGQDNMSRETLQDAMRKLQSSKGATLYAIGLTDQGMNRQAREALQRLATTTGGVAFFPKSLDEVDEITREIAHDIRSQYTLTYNPGPNIGTGYQRIEVDAKGPGKARLSVRTRNGYFPGEAMK
ncbi:MAG TPA: VWA domain-containing protein [Candidatus Sulfotelmatobacter sp.]|nr:VWA domain-containing protein [Candidatus Sulfotelmatobacter sp.]